MADAVKITTFDGNPNDGFVTVHLTNISDATGESAVLKVDRSALATATKKTIQNLALQSARWNIQGFTSVRILWDHTTDDVAMLLSGSGYEEFPFGKPDPNTSADAVSAAIGDVLLTTAGAVSGATYDITLTFRKDG